MHGRQLIGHVKYDGTCSRIISVEELEVASDVAKAMLGEEVGHNEKLSQILSVRPTDKPLGIFVFDEGRYCWNRVLKALGIHPDTIEFIYADVNGTRERVGFKKIKTAFC